MDALTLVLSPLILFCGILCGSRAPLKELYQAHGPTRCGKLCEGQRDFCTYRTKRNLFCRVVEKGMRPQSCKNPPFLPRGSAVPTTSENDRQRIETGSCNESFKFIGKLREITCHAKHPNDELENSCGPFIWRNLTKYKWYYKKLNCGYSTASTLSLKGTFGSYGKVVLHLTDRRMPCTVTVKLSKKCLKIYTSDRMVKSAHPGPSYQLHLQYLENKLEICQGVRFVHPGKSAYMVSCALATDQSEFIKFILRYDVAGGPHGFVTTNCTDVTSLRLYNTDEIIATCRQV